MNKKIIIGILFFVIVVVVALLLLPSNETSQETGGVENIFDFLPVFCVTSVPI